MDPFHVVAWATDALDLVRRGRLGRQARRNRPNRHWPKGSQRLPKYALWKNPEHLTARQGNELAWIPTDQPASSTAPI